MLPSVSTLRNRSGNDLTPMQPQPDLDPDDRIGDLAALLSQLDSPNDAVMVNGGYAELMARIASSDFRHRCGADKHRV